MAKGLFIEGMVKPEECSRRCIFADDMNYDCALIPGAEHFGTFEEQYRHCPLKEVDIQLDE